MKRPKLTEPFALKDALAAKPGQPSEKGPEIRPQEKGAEGKLVQLMVRVDASVRDDLIIIARKMGTSAQAVMRDAAVDYVERHRDKL